MLSLPIEAGWAAVSCSPTLPGQGSLPRSCDPRRTDACLTRLAAGDQTVGLGAGSAGAAAAGVCFCTELGDEVAEVIPLLLALLDELLRQQRAQGLGGALGGEQADRLRVRDLLEKVFCVSDSLTAAAFLGAAFLTLPLGAAFLGAAFLGAAFLGAAFLGAAFLTALAFFAPVFGAVFFTAIGITSMLNMFARLRPALIERSLRQFIPNL